MVTTATGLLVEVLPNAEVQYILLEEQEQQQQHSAASAPSAGTKIEHQGLFAVVAEYRTTEYLHNTREVWPEVAGGRVFLFFCLPQSLADLKDKDMIFSFFLFPLPTAALVLLRLSAALK